MDLDIVLLPPKNVSEKVGKIVRGLDSKYKFYLAVDNVHLLPHISLLHLKVSPRKLKEMVLEVGKIGEKHQKMGLKFTKPWHGKLFLVLGINKPKELYALHAEIANKISVFRNKITNLGRNDKLGKKYFKKFGVANILKFFRPHITIGHVRSQYLENILLEISKNPLPEFTASRLVVAQINKHYQVFKVIKEFKLK